MKPILTALVIIAAWVVLGYMIESYGLITAPAYWAAYGAGFMLVALGVAGRLK